MEVASDGIKGRAKNRRHSSMCWFSLTWLTSQLRPSDPSLAYLWEGSIYTASVLTGLAILFRQDDPPYFCQWLGFVLIKKYPYNRILRAVVTRNSSSSGSRHHPFLRLPSRPDNPGHHWVTLSPSHILTASASLAPSRCLLCKAILVTAPPPSTPPGSPGNPNHFGAIICTDCGIVSRISISLRNRVLEMDTGIVIFRSLASVPSV